MVTPGDEDEGNGPDPITIETFIYPEEEFFDPVTGEAATGSPLPEPTPVTITIPAPVPEAPPPPQPTPIPDPVLPEVPSGDFISPDDLARSNRAMLRLMQGLIRDALEGLGPREGGVTQEIFQAALRDQALREVARTDAVDAMFATQADRLVTLESLIATTLSQIEDRRLAEIAEVEEATGFSPMAIFTGLGDFMRDPVNYVLDKSRDQILEEISIGLNR